MSVVPAPGRLVDDAASPSSAASRSASPASPEPRPLGPADAVVGDGDPRASVACGSTSSTCDARGVLGDVGERLGDEEVRRQLDCVGEPRRPCRSITTGTARVVRAPRRPRRGRPRAAGSGACRARTPATRRAPARGRPARLPRAPAAAGSALDLRETELQRQARRAAAAHRRGGRVRADDAPRRSRRRCERGRPAPRRAARAPRPRGARSRARARPSPERIRRGRARPASAGSWTRAATGAPPATICVTARSPRSGSRRGARRVDVARSFVEPVGDLERRVAERPREPLAKSLDAPFTKLDDEARRPLTAVAASRSVLPRSRSGRRS